MNLFRTFQAQIVDVIEDLIKAGELPEGLDTSRITVEPPRDASHGDISTNAAMVLAKPAGMKPRDVAALIAPGIEALDGVENVDIAGPGFINAGLSDAFWHHQLGQILNSGTDYGNSNLGDGEKINVEYVSANPTGPLHVAHARGAVVGDALVNLLRKAGFEVTSEYYINDAGNQVDQLARSAHLRYREALGEDIGEIPEGLYPGEYMIAIGEELADTLGDGLKDAPEEEWIETFRNVAIERLMDQIKDDLAALGIEQDVFTSERDLVAAGKVEHVQELLEARGLIYRGVLEPPKGKAAPEDWEPREQTLFRATDFGDDTDRPLKKSDGSWTYFSNDIANHLDKFQRGFSTMIDVWGADHGGYVKRMQAAVRAVTEGEGELDVKLCQIVHLKKGGEPFRMSKRAGNFVTLRDLIDELGESGKDIIRFIMLTRKNDSQMDFDLDKALEQSRDNPVFYVQYAHARCHSVLRNATGVLSEADLAPEKLAGADMSVLSDPAELELIRMLANWPKTVEAAAESHEPHRIAFYLNDVAALFHGLWNKGKDNVQLRFIDEDDADATRARLALVVGVATVIASGLQVMGVTPLDELR
ncbi:MAG: arginine--tRNA ligase [Rhodospirillales bacterium]|nr:arginine--tRNA ligase [Rhodospirillales bacterium]MBO6786388.1 arginine--tRNA ligase [Rhodospirillales bacterium]